MKLEFDVKNDQSATLYVKSKYLIPEGEGDPDIPPGKLKRLPFKPENKRLEMEFYTQEKSFNIKYFHIRKVPGKLKEVELKESGKRNWHLIMIWSELPEEPIDIEPPPPANVDVGVKE